MNFVKTAGEGRSGDEQSDRFRSQIAESSKNFDDRDIVIWGTHRKGAAAKALVEEMGCNCAFFVSSRPKVTMFCGLPVLKPDVLDKKKHYVISSIMSLEVEQYLVNEFAGTCCKDYIRLGFHDDIVYQGCPVGSWTYGYSTLVIGLDSLGDLVKKIGRYCSINALAKVWENHPMDYVSTSPYIYDRTGERRTFDLTEIGNDVWIGANVVIVSGVKIGDGAIIGAGSIVTHDVEPYSVVAGVPARVIRYRYPREMIEAFLRIKWWNWPIEDIERNIKLFYQPELFCQTFD